MTPSRCYNMVLYRKLMIILVLELGYTSIGASPLADGILRYRK